ncbi:hypothetical protein [Flavobacterium sp.]|jgi:hypothetical protein|uniref:hypothetical protein n=1 Tax=Flavobacterium sp. TaxID=239 RepID=UPI0037C0137B
MRFCLFISILFIVSCSPKKLEDVDSLEDGKKRVDFFFNKHISLYEELCSEPRNEELKKKYYDLHDVLLVYYYCGEKCIKLDYSKQKEITDYAVKKLKSHNGLHKLVERGEIDCW